MNKLTLSCLQSLVQTRPKGDWDFLTKLVLVWPEARIYYWNKKGFRTLLKSWPLLSMDHPASLSSSLWLPEGKVLHGLQVKRNYFSGLTICFYERGEYLMALSCTLLPRGDTTYWMKQDLKNLGSCNQLDMLVWTPMKNRMSCPFALKPEDWIQLYQEYPVIKQSVIKALKLARDLGKTNIKTLNTLAALTSEA